MQLTRITLLKACAAGLIAFKILNGATVRGDDKPTNWVEQAEDGTMKLGAAKAKINGPNARLEGGDLRDIIWWTSEDTSVHWLAHVNKPGNYRVELTYSIIGSNNGSPLVIMVGNQAVKATPKAGDGMNDYRTGDAGQVKIGKPGDLGVVIRPLLKHHEFVINVRSVDLLPVQTSAPAIDISGAAIKQTDDGSFNLTAGDAEIDGMNALLEQPKDSTEKDIGFWKEPGHVLRMEDKRPEAGEISRRVELCPESTQRGLQVGHHGGRSESNGKTQRNQRLVRLQNRHGG